MYLRSLKPTVSGLNLIKIWLSRNQISTWKKTYNQMKSSSEAPNVRFKYFNSSLSRIYMPSWISQRVDLRGDRRKHLDLAILACWFQVADQRNESAIGPRIDRPLTDHSLPKERLICLFQLLRGLIVEDLSSKWNGSAEIKAAWDHKVHLRVYSKSLESFWNCHWG